MKLELWMSWVAGIFSTIVILILLFLLYVYLCSKSRKIELLIEQDFFLALVCSLIFAIAIGMTVGSILHDSYDRINPNSVEETILYNPVSMNDVIACEGKQYGAYLQIDAEQFYTFYYKDENGYKTGKISSNDAIVYQTDEVNPYILKRTTKKACGELISIEYEIYIPKGSIIEKFNLYSN